MARTVKKQQNGSTNKRAEAKKSIAKQQTSNVQKNKKAPAPPKPAQAKKSVAQQKAALKQTYEQSHVGHKAQKIQAFKKQIGKDLSNPQIEDILQRFNWNVDQAVESYVIEQTHFEKKAPRQVVKKLMADQSLKIEEFFQKFVSDKTETSLDKMHMNSQDIQDFLEKIEVDLEDPVALAISASMYGVTSKVSSSDVKIDDEPAWTFKMFNTGCKYWSAFSVQEWKSCVPKIRKTLKSELNYFENIYVFAFDSQQDKGFKNIKTDDAVALWTILLKGKCSFLDQWIEFLNKNIEKNSIIKRDCWTMFFHLIQKTDGEIRKYAEVDDGSWPLIFDEFYEFIQSK